MDMKNADGTCHVDSYYGYLSILTRVSLNGHDRRTTQIVKLAIYQFKRLDSHYIGYLVGGKIEFIMMQSG